MRDNIVTLFRKYANVFTFSANDIPRVNLNVINHKLHIDLKTNAVK